MRRIRSIACFFTMLGAALAFLFLLADPAAADNCSSKEDCEDTGGYTGIIGVVGGGAAVAAAAAAASAAAAGADGVEGTEDDEEIDLSILQVSENLITVSPGSPEQFTVTGWHVGADGQQRQTDMQFLVEVPPGTGLRVTPTTGITHMVVNVEVDERTVLEKVVIQVQGTHRGRTHVEPVTVEIGDELELRLI